MEEASDGLRKAAPNWSLDGDKKLLNLLQNMHQKIIEKCQDTNKQLEHMASDLDDASISLQNVNNKFTALSNSQFIESRVYDDDYSDSALPETPKTQPAPVQVSELDSIKESLFVLERMHEAVTILCDSDSDSGSDEEDDGTRLVVKPKDVYASRPLPYIIGSQQWKNKWHAGLIREDSESECELASSKPPREQYSSDSETESERHSHSPAMSSCTLDSRIPDTDLVFNSETPYHTDVQPKSQSDVAAELARRLGAPAAKTPAFEPEIHTPEPVLRKLYAPHQPTPGAIFSDEPPPLENDQSEESDHDIFAEIYKTSSYAHGDKDHVSVADDLFGKPIFDEQMPPTNAYQTPTSKEVLTSNENISTRNSQTENNNTSVKKPVGGQSIFGSNANSESIGAAILKRKSRQSSTSGDDTDQETPPIAKPAETAVDKNIDNISTKVKNESQHQKQSDIFDELFAKSERVNKELDKKLKEPIHDKVTKTPVKHEKKIDLFSDNIFDDIDDIFTTNVTINAKEKRAKENTSAKSIFDEEDDDLFSDLAAHKKSTKDIDKKDKESIKSNVIETEDDLFNIKQKEVTVTDINTNKDKAIMNIIKESKGLFDDSDDDLFSDFNKPKNSRPISKTDPSSDLFSDDDNLFINKTTATRKDAPKLIINESEPNNTSDVKSKSPDLINDDIINNTMSPKSGVNIDVKETPHIDISNKKFKAKEPTLVDIIKQDIDENPTQENKKCNVSTELLKKENSNIGTKHNIFEDDSEDDLFGKSKVCPDISKKELLPEDRITEDKSNKIEKNENILNRTEVAKSLDVETRVTILKEVINESRAVDDLNTINAQVTTSENISRNTAMPKPEISVKPTVPVINPQIQPVDKSEDTYFSNTKKIDLQNDKTSDIFFEETQSPFPRLPKDTPESKTDTQKDLFTDIFNDQPPEFEKPKEPKRSKNVNALFDDDSDDESLFFKKNDVITDERPEGFTTNDDRLFGLFRDEPPAIDVDFVQKPNKKGHTESHITENKGKRSDVIKNNDGSSLFPAMTVIEKSNKKDVKHILNKADSNDFDSNDNDPVMGANENFETSEVKNLFNADVVKIETQDITDSPQLESKKIGKLKPMSFNINVNTLLPGASPKKSENREVMDSNVTVQTIDKSSKQLVKKEVDIPDNTVSNLVRSVSFEGEPDSAVLDNKLSKERVKIQVKRRPSTRRARREAVKKSGIDFGKDSTDNSTTVDDSKQVKIISMETTKTTDFENDISQIENKVEIFREEQVVLNVEPEQMKAENTKEECHNREIEQRDSKLEIDKQGDELDERLMVPSGKPEQGAPDLISTGIEVANNMSENTEDLKTQSTQRKITKSKVVYVLNDDDIFNTSSLEKDTNYTKKSVFDDADDIFKTIRVSKDEKAAVVDAKQVQSFKTKTSHKPAPKTELFAYDSDSENDDLFKKVSKPVTNIQTSEAENIKSAKVVEVEDPFKNASNPVISQTSESDIKTKTALDNETEGLLKKELNPVIDQSEFGKNILSDDEEENLFKTIPVSVPNDAKTAEDCLKTTTDADRSKNISRTTIKEQKTSATTIVGDEDESLFKNIPESSQKSQDPKSNIIKKTSIFDSDEDLFKNNNMKVEKVTKPSLFSSDSDEELFSGKKKETEHTRRQKEIVFEKKIEVKKIDKKMSLFGDESDDDDLFGAKPKQTAESKPRPSPARDVPKDTSIKSKAVLEDPLSLFGDDD